MIKINKKLIFSPLGIFIIYILVSCLLILGFRFILPPEAPPLPYYSTRWRLNQGILTFLGLFPALALSALVVPYGLRENSEEEFPAFSPRFLELITNSIITAIAAAALYGLLFFLVLPLNQDREAGMRSGGRLFQLARERARRHVETQEWPQAVQFVALCERIWPNSPEMESLRVASSIGMEEYRLTQGGAALKSGGGRAAAPVQGEAALSGIPGQRDPVSAGEAMAMAESARQEGRYYDAHWLATLAGRLSRPGSVEAVAATRLASGIWNQLAEVSPNARETRAWNLYRLKREGYEAMISGDWIRAYYLFRDHAAQSPGDPDVENYLLICERGIGEIAFFIDEMDMTLGEILTGAVFSLPAETSPGRSGGRVVLRISSLSTFPDISFGVGIELIALDRDERFLYRMEAPYAKIVPLPMDTGPRLVLLMRALDRVDGSKRWEPLYSAEPRPGEDPSPEAAALAASMADSAQLVLNLGYEDFIILSKIRRGLSSLDPADLFIAEKRLGSYGYLPQLFQAEIIYRFCEPIFFLPMTILALLIGWRFRAKVKPRYTGVPMLAVLPLVFFGVVHFYRSCLNNLAIWTVAAFGYSPALALFIAGTVILFILSLILLSAQRR